MKKIITAAATAARTAAHTIAVRAADVRGKARRCDDCGARPFAACGWDCQSNWN